MAVYTHLSERALRQHLRPFRLGAFVEARGVSAGTINTIYEVHTEQGRYILRILENRSLSDARFEEVLLTRLHDRGLSVPRMISAGKRGCVISISPRQHLSVFEFLEGREVGVFEVTVEHAEQVGQFLARLHLASRGLGRRRANRYDPDHIRRVGEKCRAAPVDDALRADLSTIEREVARHRWARDLPRGIVHGDLFIDNVRFRSGKLCGVLDFEMASTSPMIFDLAVAMGDWAFSHDRFLPERAAALLQGYARQRPLKEQELDGLYEMCRFAAARFAMTRFYDFEVRRRPEAQRLYKDYRHFLERLRALQQLGARAFANGVLGAQKSAVP